MNKAHIKILGWVKKLYLYLQNSELDKQNKTILKAVCVRILIIKETERNDIHQVHIWGWMPRRLPRLCSGKKIHLPKQRHKRDGFSLRIWKIPQKRAWQPTPVFLPWKSHGQRSLGVIVHGIVELSMHAPRRRF